MPESSGNGGNPPAGAAPAPAEGAPAEPAKTAPAEPAPAEQTHDAPAEPAEQAPANSAEQAPADSAEPASAPAADREEPRTEPDQQAPSRNDNSAPGDTPGGELGKRVFGENPLSDADTGAMTEAGDQATRTAENLRGTAEDTTRATGEADWRDPAGQQHAEQVNAQAADAAALGDGMDALGRYLGEGARIQDGVRSTRVGEVDQDNPVYELAGATLPPPESDATQNRVARDAITRDRELIDQGTELMRRAGEQFMHGTEQAFGALREPTEQVSQALREQGWSVTPVQYERGPVERPHRLETTVAEGKNGWRERLSGANKTGDNAERSKLTDPSAVVNYDAVRDASIQLDSGQRNLELAGKDVPVHVTADATAWRSDQLPNQGGWYTEYLDTPTPKAGRFEGKAAWGAGSSLVGRATVGDVTVVGDVTASVGLEGKAKLDVGPRFFGGELGGSVGVRAGAGGFAEYGGIGVGGRAERILGLGLEGGVSFGVNENNQWVVGGKIGAALGIGGKVEGHIVIDPERAGRTLADLGSAIAEGFRNPGPAIPSPTFY
ncbi:hypothetical protein L1857_18745 [Amycolatopsis thermalba]|uniref:Uncharacterized protein n=1 Tax=Amycolatopsis thermalba TaxID=944492 RepID=A0ABY4NXA3_9PSEU|nr:hypothetical protein [Amycolatopsis thermalba]UQS24712.1 hypothetical protein L1857_18745 [Amycolatopsis thermalba]